MKLLIATFVTLSTLLAPLAQAAETDYVLHRAIEFLDGKVELRHRTATDKTKRAGLITGYVGAIALASFILSDLFPVNISDGLAVTWAFGAVGGAAAGFGTYGLISYNQHNKAAKVLESGGSFVNDKNIRYFFALSLEDQYRAASADPELRAFVLKLAEAHDYFLNALPSDQTQVKPAL